jgi:hypothetical protein
MGWEGRAGRRNSPAHATSTTTTHNQHQATPQAPSPTDPFHSPGVHILLPDAAQ